jgi:hypothetical protein
MGARMRISPPHRRHGSGSTSKIRFNTFTWRYLAAGTSCQSGVAPSAAGAFGQIGHAARRCPLQVILAAA